MWKERGGDIERKLKKYNVKRFTQIFTALVIFYV